MEPITNNPPLIVILGPTASGKTALAIHIAQEFNGEIIAADSRTVYRGMDIGTAKPTNEERQLVPHHVIDVVDPNEIFTVADFQRLANMAIADISSREKLPIMVGGSGLYIDSVIYNFSFRREADRKDRKEYEALSVEQLQKLILERNLPLPQNDRNPRHLVRTLESNGEQGGRADLRANTLVLGLDRPSAELRSRITARVDSMVGDGFIDEISELLKMYDDDTPALQAPGYSAFRQYVSGKLTLQEAKELFIQSDWRLVRRQRSWFRRSKDIHWISKTAEAVDLVTTFLSK